MQSTLGADNKLSDSQGEHFIPAQLKMMYETTKDYSQ